MSKSGTTPPQNSVPKHSLQVQPPQTAHSNPTPKAKSQAKPTTPASPKNLGHQHKILSAALQALDVHTGYGHPGSGQTSNEVHGDGRKEKSGLAGVGADPRDQVRERALDTDAPAGTRGKSGANRGGIPGAEERLTESAESVVAERD